MTVFLALESTAIPLAFAVLTLVALLFSIGANAAHARNNERLSDELNVTKEAADAGAHALAKVMSGQSLVDALEQLPHDPEAVDVFKRLLSYATSKFAKPAAVLLCTLALGLLSVGCSGPEAQKVEAAGKTAVTDTVAVLESGVAAVENMLSLVRTNAAPISAVLAVANTAIPPGTDASELGQDGQALVTLIQTSSNQQLLADAVAELKSKIAAAKSKRAKP